MSYHHQHHKDRQGIRQLFIQDHKAILRRSALHFPHLVLGVSNRASHRSPQHRYSQRQCLRLSREILTWPSLELRREHLLKGRRRGKQGLLSIPDGHRKSFRAGAKDQHVGKGIGLQMILFIFSGWIRHYINICHIQMDNLWYDNNN